MTRRHRIAAALFALLAIVFAQLAVAAHVCDFPGQPKAVTLAAGHECCNEDMGTDGNPAPTGLCVQHCHYGEASFDGGQPLAALVDSSGAILRVDGADPHLAAGTAAGASLAPAAAGPPATILFGVLRI